MAIGADFAEKGKEGVFFGTLQGAHFLGIGFGPLISGVLTDHFGWHVPFYFMTALTALALVMVIKTPRRADCQTFFQRPNAFFYWWNDKELCPSYMFLLPILLCLVSGHNAHGHSPYGGRFVPILLTNRNNIISELSYNWCTAKIFRETRRQDIPV